MKKTVKLTAILLAFVLAVSAVAPSFASSAAAAEGYSVIINPYEKIDWDNVKAYKTGLHNHTNASDGDPTLKQSIERHAECGFDIVAITDHGTVNYTWETENADSLIHGGLRLVGKSEGELEYLGKEGKFDNGTSYKYATEANGDDYLTLDSGKKIMRIPYGIEQNAVSANAHVNSWFADYHNNGLTVYKDAVKNVDKLGGVCVINHPGEYSKARYELHSADAYNTDNLSYKYIVNKFASLLDGYSACIGIDINSKGDGRTRFDRILWDILLERFSSNGRTVNAICSSDAHQLDKIDTGFTYVLMKNQDSASLKSALLNGEFIGGSHCNGNPDELKEIAASLKEFYGETDIYKEITEVTGKMDKRVEEIENGERDADDDIGETYSVLDENGYYKGKTEPMVTSITAEGDRITVNTENALLVRWISNGKTVLTSKPEEATITLGDYAGKIGDYIRAEVFGEGGFLYTQAFILKSAATKPMPVVEGVFIDFGFLDCLLPIFKNWADILGRMI